MDTTYINRPRKWSVYSGLGRPSVQVSSLVLYFIHIFHTMNSGAVRSLSVVWWFVSFFITKNSDHYNRRPALKHSSRKLLCSKAEFESHLSVSQTSFYSQDRKNLFCTTCTFFFYFFYSASDLEIHLCRAYHSFLIIFHWIDMPQSVYPFTCLWTFWVVSSLGLLPIKLQWKPGHKKKPISMTLSSRSIPPTQHLLLPSQNVHLLGNATFPSFQISSLHVSVLCCQKRPMAQAQAKHALCHLNSAVWLTTSIIFPIWNFVLGLLAWKPWKPTDSTLNADASARTDGWETMKVLEMSCAKKL